jgi:uncharacterized protein YhaN
MRIDELQLRSFGPFTDINVVFEKRDGDFHIIYGRNEAGKSSALRALKSLFFGIPHHTTDNFLHDNSKLRVGGQIRNSDGSDIFFMRRKGSKNTLLNINEKPLEEAVLSRFLQGATEELFEAFFGIDHDSLAKGSQSILQEGGAVGQTLFSAGMGGVDLQALLQEFDDEADLLFRPRGHTLVINKAINDYADFKKTISEASLPSRIWLEHNQELKKALDDRESVLKKIEIARHEKSQVGRLQQTLPDIALRAKLMADLLSLGDVVIVDDDFGVKRKEYLNQLRTANETKERTTDEVAQIKGSINLITVPEGILDQAETILDLHQRLGSQRKGLQDLGKLRGNIQQLNQEIEILASEIKPGAEVEDCLGLRPNAALRAKIQDLGGRHQALLDAMERSSKDIRKLEADIKKTTEELQTLDTPKDIDALKAAVLKAQKKGDLTLSLEEARARLDAEQEQISVELKRLPLWSQGIGELEKVAVPSPETVDRYETRFYEITARLTSLDEKEKEAKTELTTVGLKIETLRMSGAVPSEDELLKVRARRDLGWSLVYRSWINNEAIPEEATAFDPNDDLPKAYEKTVAQVDDIADRLRREADRVAQNANFIAQQTAIQQNRADIEENKKNLNNQLNEIELEWNKQWEPAGIKPLSPKEMRSWSVKQAALIQRANKSRELRQAYEQIIRLIEEHRASLTACLNDLSQKYNTNKPFDTLLVDCQSVIDSTEAANRKKADLEKKTAELESELKALHQNDEDLKKQDINWQSDWKGAVAKLGLEPETSPAEAYAVLSKIDELFKKVDERTSIERRVFGINRDAGDFSSDVEKLVTRIATELIGLPLEQAVAQLNASLSKAKTDAARLEDLEMRLGKQEKILRTAEETIKIALKQLDSLCMKVGCAGHEDLEEIERKSSLKQSIQEKIDSTERRLLGAGGGMSIEELIEETKGIDADSLPGRMSEVDRQLDELEAKRSDLDRRLGGMQTILAQMDGSAKAADAAEQSQQILTSLREKVERYVHLRMCSMILTREIERYRSENQEPLIKRASQLFSTLTLNSFAGLTTDFNDKDVPIIVGVRPAGEKIGVSGMSDGTRDQLYLALRVASLEKYVDANEPMPFIVDDILIRFDDERAMAALNVLVDLSKKTQVLFLTHHTRLVELAQKETSHEAPAIYFLK